MELKSVNLAIQQNSELQTAEDVQVEVYVQSLRECKYRFSVMDSRPVLQQVPFIPIWTAFPEGLHVSFIRSYQSTSYLSFQSIFNNHHRSANEQVVCTLKNDKQRIKVPSISCRQIGQDPWV